MTIAFVMMEHRYLVTNGPQKSGRINRVALLKAFFQQENDWLNLCSGHNKVVEVAELTWWPQCGFLLQIHLDSCFCFQMVAQGVCKSNLGLVSDYPVFIVTDSASYKIHRLNGR